MAIRDLCACGRLIDSRVWKQHGRKCTARLVGWARGSSAHNVRGLDERLPHNRPVGCRCHLPPPDYDSMVEDVYPCEVCQSAVMGA